MTYWVGSSLPPHPEIKDRTPLANGARRRSWAMPELDHFGLIQGRLIERDH